MEVAQQARGGGVLRGQGDRPLLIYVGGLVLAVSSVSGLLFVAMITYETMGDPQGLSLSAFGADGLTGGQILAAVPVLVLLGIGQAVLAYGLLRERTWARPLGAFLWFGMALVNGGVQLIAGLHPAFFIRALLWGLGSTALAYWYLYGKRSVRAYYERLDHLTPT